MVGNPLASNSLASVGNFENVLVDIILGLQMTEVFLYFEDLAVPIGMCRLSPEQH